MSSQIPTTMKAVVLDKVDHISVKDVPVPSIADDEVLIKTAAVALNPADHKVIDWKIGTEGSITGYDVSGIVVQVGKAVNSPKVGDHVAGMVFGAAYPDEGAFAEYAKAAADLVWVVPENTFSHELTAAYSLAFWTAVQALYAPGRLGLVEPPAKVPAPEWLLIYGGSAAVGLFAIQLAHLSGYKVVTTASPRNHALLKSLGADVTIDYHDADVVAQIKQATGDSLRLALDTIGEPATHKAAAEAFGLSGGRLVGINLMLNGFDAGREDVTVTETGVFTALGRALTVANLQVPAAPKDKAHMVAFLKKLPQLVRDGSLKPIPLKRWEGGLEAIQDGLQYMREGKVSAEKVVYTL